MRLSAEARLAARERAIHADQRVEHFAFGRRQRREFLAQAALQIFQDQRHHGHVGDLVLRESFADKFRPQRAQMNDGRRRR